MQPYSAAEELWVSNIEGTMSFYTVIRLPLGDESIPDATQSMIASSVQSTLMENALGAAGIQGSESLISTKAETPAAQNLGYGRVTSIARLVGREVNTVYGIPVSVARIISDITTASVVYSHVPTGEASDGTLPRYYGALPKHIVVGKKFAGDVAGHIIGRALGGLLHGGNNLFSQDRQINNSLYRTIENKVLRTLRDNQDWTAHISVVLNYTGFGRFRPVGGIYSVLYTDRNGRTMSFSSDPFPNR